MLLLLLWLLLVLSWVVLLLVMLLAVSRVADVVVAVVVGIVVGDIVVVVAGYAVVLVVVAIVVVAIVFFVRFPIPLWLSFKPAPQSIVVVVFLIFFPTMAVLKKPSAGAVLKRPSRGRPVSTDRGFRINAPPLGHIQPLIGLRGMPREAICTGKKNGQHQPFQQKIALPRRPHLAREYFRCFSGGNCAPSTNSLAEGP